jgi:hypothetical protein
MYENELAQFQPSQNPAVNQVAAEGRGGDAMMAHVTPGDYVIPKDILVQHPDFLVKLKKVMADQHEDYRSHMVGSGFENINPETGAPEFKFSLKRAARSVVGQPLSQVGNFVGEATRGIPGVGAYYAGSGQLMSKVADTIPGQKQFSGSQGFFGGLASGAGGTPNYYDPSKPQDQQEGAAAAAPYTPTKMALPGSLQEMGGLSDEQQRSWLATQGSQGAGIGGSSRDYYSNLLQRNILEGKGNLLPVESQYLASQGINTNLTGQALIDALRGF